MLRLRKIAFLSVFLLLIAAAPAWSLHVGESAPDFTLTTLEGEPVRLSDFKGKKPVMLVFWATWCPSCEKEIPQIKEIAATFGPQGLAVLAVNVGVNDSPRKVQTYRDRHKVDYPIAFDQGSRVSRAFGVVGTPTVVITDKNGIVRYRGSAVPEDLADHFAKLME